MQLSNTKSFSFTLSIFIPIFSTLGLPAVPFSAVLYIPLTNLYPQKKRIYRRSGDIHGGGRTPIIPRYILIHVYTSPGLNPPTSIYFMRLLCVPYLSSMCIPPQRRPQPLEISSVALVCIYYSPFVSCLGLPYPHLCTPPSVCIPLCGSSFCAQCLSVISHIWILSLRVIIHRRLYPSSYVYHAVMCAYYMYVQES